MIKIKKLHKNSVLFGFSLFVLLYCLIKKSTYYLFRSWSFLSSLPLIGGIFKKNKWSSLFAIYYGGYYATGWNIPEEYKDGYESSAKEGMTADDLINANNGNKTNTSNSSSSSSSIDYLSIFQRWVSITGMQSIWNKSSFWDLFKYDWLEDENLGHKLCDSIFGGYYKYLMSYGSSASKNSPSQNLSLVLKCIKENSNFIDVYNKMHNDVYGLTKKLLPIITKSDFKKLNINQDSSKLYEYRTNWGSNDADKLEICRQQLLNWLSPYVVKANENFVKDTHYTVL